MVAACAGAAALMFLGCGLLPVRRSDISVWNRIRVVPTIYFYDEGAVVSSAAQPESAVCAGLATHLRWAQGSSALCTGRGAATPACSELGRGCDVYWCAAQVKKITMHDVRRMGENYSSVSYVEAVHVARIAYSLPDLQQVQCQPVAVPVAGNSWLASLAGH